MFSHVLPPSTLTAKLSTNKRERKEKKKETVRGNFISNKVDVCVPAGQNSAFPCVSSGLFRIS